MLVRRKVSGFVATVFLALSQCFCAVAYAQLPVGFVDASTFGYNPVDATSALQAAINTGQNVYVPSMASNWNVRPITLTHSNQEIRFEDGVVVAAKAGAFTDVDDALFTSVGTSNVKLSGYGATFRMRKSDYQGPSYTPGEWRHGVNLLDVSDFQIEGLRIEDTGGDGIYVGTNSQTGYSQNVTIKDIVLNNNHRQGISVISVENMIVDNAVISNTSGTAPEAGIDFEVNYETQRIVNVAVRNSIIDANNSHGILFAGYSDLGENEITVAIENVTIYNNQAEGISMVYGAYPGVTIQDSLIVSNGGYGIVGTTLTKELSLGDFNGTGPSRTSFDHTALWNNGDGALIGAYVGWVKLGTGSLVRTAPVFYSTDPSSPYYLYLDPSTPLSISQGAQDGGYMGARPVYTGQILAGIDAGSYTGTDSRSVPEPSALLLIAISIACCTGGARPLGRCMAPEAVFGQKSDSLESL